MKNLKNLPLSQNTISIILGSILGDGGLKIYKNYVNARLNITHSINQKSYFDYKVSALSEINRKKNTLSQPVSKHNKNIKLKYFSACLPVLTDIYNITYHKNKLNILRK